MSLLSRVVKTLFLPSEAPSVFEVRPYSSLSSFQTEVLLVGVSDEGRGNRQEGRVYTVAPLSLLRLELWQGICGQGSELCGHGLHAQWTLLPRGQEGAVEQIHG